MMRDPHDFDLPSWAEDGPSPDDEAEALERRLARADDEDEKADRDDDEKRQGRR